MAAPWTALYLLIPCVILVAEPTYGVPDDALIELVNVKMHTVKKIAAAQVTELAESNGSDDKHDDSRRRRKTENGSDDAQADNGSDDEQAQNGSDDGQASDEQAGLFGTEVTDKKLKRKPKDPQMVTTAATVLHDLRVDQAWQNCDLPMTGNAKSEDGDSVRMCAKCSDGYYMLATGYSETKVFGRCMLVDELKEWKNVMLAGKAGISSSMQCHRFSSVFGKPYDNENLKSKNTADGKGVNARRDPKKESSEEPQAFICWGGSQEVQIDLQQTLNEHFLKLHQFTIARFTECHSESWTNPTLLTCVKKKILTQCKTFRARPGDFASDSTKDATGFREVTVRGAGSRARNMTRDEKVEKRRETSFGDFVRVLSANFVTDRRIAPLVGEQSGKEFLQVPLNQSEEQIFNELVAKYPPSIYKFLTPYGIIRMITKAKSNGASPYGSRVRSIEKKARVALAAWAQYVKDLVLQQVTEENKYPDMNSTEHLVHPETKGFTAWADSEFVSNCDAADAQTVTSLY